MNEKNTEPQATERNKNENRRTVSTSNMLGEQIGQLRYCVALFWGKGEPCVIARCMHLTDAEAVVRNHRGSEVHYAIIDMETGKEAL